MKSHLNFLWFFILTFSVFTTRADAIAVTPLVIDMNSTTDRVRNITVSNTGENTAYVLIDLGLVKDPNNLADLEKSTDPSKLGLLVSPKKMVIPVGQSRLLRIVNLNPTVDKDKFYAVKVSPVIGEAQEVEQNDNKNIAVKVKLQINYLVKVFVRPNNPITNITLTRTDQKLIAKNNGTTNGLLFDGNQCLDEKNCKEIPGQRLFPGQTWETTLPFKSPVSYSVSYGTKEDKIHSN